MTLVFMDGFSHYSTAQIPLKWSGGFSGTPTITGSAGRVNGDAMVTNSNEYVRKAFSPPIQELIIGVAHKVVSDSTDANVVAFESIGGTVLAEIYWDVSDERYYASIASLDDVFSAGVTQGDWNYLELKVKVDNLDGSWEFKLNGNTVASQTGVDTQQSTAGTYIGLVRIGPTTGFGEHHFDDLYICNTSGSTNNDFLGDVVVETIFPNANGTTTDFTPLSGNNFENVDEANHDGDTTYNSSNTVGDKDTLDFPSLSASSGSVFGVQTHYTARKEDLGVRGMRDVIRSGGTDYSGTSVNLGNSFRTFSEIHETDPDTSSAWTISGVNSAEFGYEIQT